jgi:hypothetical protein
LYDRLCARNLGAVRRADGWVIERCPLPGHAPTRWPDADGGVGDLDGATGAAAPQPKNPMFHIGITRQLEDGYRRVRQVDDPLLEDARLHVIARFTIVSRSGSSGQRSWYQAQGTRDGCP